LNVHLEDKVEQGAKRSIGLPLLVLRDIIGIAFLSPSYPPAGLVSESLFPDRWIESSAAQSTGVNLESLALLAAEYLPIQISEDEALTLAGLDSISGIEFVRRLEGLVSHALGTSFLYNHPTLRQISSTLLQKVSKDNCATDDYQQRDLPILLGYEPVRSFLTCVQHGRKVATFLVPAAMGHIAGVERQMFDHQHAVYAFKHAYLETGDLAVLTLSVLELATCYATAMAFEIETNGNTAARLDKYAIVGLSFGGCLAHLVALSAHDQLQLLGRLVLIDPVPPLCFKFRLAQFHNHFGASITHAAIQYLKTVMGDTPVDMASVPESEIGIHVASCMTSTFGGQLNVKILCRATRVPHVIFQTNEAWCTARGTAVPAYSGELLTVVASQRESYFQICLGYSSEDCGTQALQAYGVPELWEIDGDHLQVVRDFLLGHITKVSNWLGQ